MRTWHHRPVTANLQQPALILWDIDHTLLAIDGVSRELYEIAFAEVVEQPLHKMAEMSGRTEQAIVIETLDLNGVSNPESKLDDFYEALAKAADQLRTRMHTVGRQLPGAVEALAALTDRGAVQTVVTGNIRPLAEAKLEIFDLSEYLDLEIGGYGSEADTRPPLIRQAWQRTQRKYGRTFESDRIAVIGDTHRDVAGAREVGVRAIGVATGNSTADELIAAHADTVLLDLADTEAVLRAIYH